MLFCQKYESSSVSGLQTHSLHCGPFKQMVPKISDTKTHSWNPRLILHFSPPKLHSLKLVTSSVQNIISACSLRRSQVFSISTHQYLMGLYEAFCDIYKKCLWWLKRQPWPGYSLSKYVLKEIFTNWIRTMVIKSKDKRNVYQDEDFFFIDQAILITTEWIF